MDLESVNKEYLNLKKELQEVSDRIEKFEKDVVNLSDDKQIAQADRIKAERSGDDAGIKAANAEIERIDKELTNIIEQSKEEKANQISLNIKLNDIIESIKTNPEMIEHLNEVMAKRYERKIGDLEEGTIDKNGKVVKEGKKQAIEKKDRLMALQQVIIDHPTVGNNLTGVIVAKQQVKELEDELSKLDFSKAEDHERLAEIKDKEMPKAQDKLTKNKTLLMDNLAKFAPEINEKDVDDLAEQGFAKSKDGKELDVQTTLNRHVKGLDRRIQGYDKQIAYHKTALQNVNRDRAQNQHQQRNSQLPALVEPVAPSKPRFSGWRQFWNTKGWKEYEEKLEEYNEEKRLYDEEVAKREEVEPPEENKNNSFRDSMKYEVTRDILDKMQEEHFEEAKEETKNQDQDNTR